MVHVHQEWLLLLVKTLINGIIMTYPNLLVLTNIRSGWLIEPVRWMHYPLGNISSDWWFGTFFIFPYIGDNNPN